MTNIILLFLSVPLFMFGTIEIATKKVPTKEVTSEQEKPASAKKTSLQTSHPGQAPKKASPSPSPSPENTPEEDLTEDFPQADVKTPPFLDTQYQKQFFRTLIFIFLLIVFAMIIVFIYRRASPMSKITKRNSRTNIKILERRALSQQTYLYHVQVGDKQFILSESKLEVKNVATLDWPDRK